MRISNSTLPNSSPHFPSKPVPPHRVPFSCGGTSISPITQVETLLSLSLNPYVKSITKTGWLNPQIFLDFVPFILSLLYQGRLILIKYSLPHPPQEKGTSLSYWYRLWPCDLLWATEWQRIWLWLCGWTQSLWSCCLFCEHSSGSLDHLNLSDPQTQEQGEEAYACVLLRFGRLVSK